MKIDATSSVYSVEMYKSQAAHKTADKKVAVETSDQVHLSTDALTFAETFSAIKTTLTKQLSEPNPMVETVRAQMANGTYTVNPDEVASSILFFT